MPKHWVLWAALLTGCSQTATDIGLPEDALERIGRLLNQSPAPLSVSDKRPFDFRPAAFSEARIGFGNALALGECGLVPLIAERNSALGRQKEESIRFVYEWKIRHGLAECVALQGDQDWFEQALAQKRQDLDAAINQLLLHSEEAEALRNPLSSAYGSITQSASAYASAFAQIRATVLQASQGQPPAEADQISEFEDALKQWGDTRHHAALGRAIRHASAWLVSANQMQARAIATNRLCPMGTATAEGKRLQQFIGGYFARDIQTPIAHIRQAADAFDQQWALLSDIPTLATVDSEALLMLPEGMLDSFDGLWQTHIEQWQTLLAQCDLAPRAATM